MQKPRLNIVIKFILQMQLHSLYNFKLFTCIYINEKKLCKKIYQEVRP